MTTSWSGTRWFSKIVVEPTVVCGEADRATGGEARCARLVVVSGSCAGAAISLGDDETTVGRAPNNDVVLPDVSVSRRHASVRRERGGYLLFDRESGNGTRLNGRSIAAARLRNGDEIALGDALVQFVDVGQTAARGRKPVCGIADVLRGARLTASSTRARAALGVAALLLVATAVGFGRQKHGETGIARGSGAATAAPVEDSSTMANGSRAESASTERSPAPRSDGEAKLERASREPSSARRSDAAAKFAEKHVPAVVRRRNDERARRLAVATAVSPSLALSQTRNSLAAEHARIGAAQLAGGQLGPAASHLREALRYDPRDDSTRAELERIVALANDAYLRGYVAREIDEDAAREHFRTVVAVLPPDDATARKARRWLGRLDGKRGEDD